MRHIDGWKNVLQSIDRIHGSMSNQFIKNCRKNSRQPRISWRAEMKQTIRQAIWVIFQLNIGQNVQCSLKLHHTPPPLFTLLFSRRFNVLWIAIGEVWQLSNFNWISFLNSRAFFLSIDNNHILCAHKTLESISVFFVGRMKNMEVLGTFTHAKKNTNPSLTQIYHNFGSASLFYHPTIKHKCQLLTLLKSIYK